MKFFLCLVLIMVFFVFLVSADPLEFEFTQNNYFKGEILQVWINFSEGVREELKHTDLGLLKEGTEITVYPYLVKLSEDYYFAYYKLPLEAGQYSFLVKDLLYLDNGVLKSEDFTSDFEILDDVSINLHPGIFKIENLNRDYVFQLFVKNNKEEQIDVLFSKNKQYTFLGSSGFSLNPGQTKVLSVFFDHTFVENIENDEIMISFDGKIYGVPIWLGFEEEIEPVEPTPPINNTPEINETNQTIDPEINITSNESESPSGQIEFVNQFAYLNKTLSYGEKTEGSLYFRSYVDQIVEEVNFVFIGNLDQIAELSIYSFDEVRPNELNSTYLIINLEGDAEPGEYVGAVRLEYGNKSTDFPINLIIKDQEVVDDGRDTDDGFVELDANETSYAGFDTNYTSSYDDPESNGKTWLWIFLGTVLVIGIILFIVFKKKIKKTEANFFGQ